MTFEDKVRRYKKSGECKFLPDDFLSSGKNGYFSLLMLRTFLVALSKKTQA